MFFHIRHPTLQYRNINLRYRIFHFHIRKVAIRI